jgi:serine protease AprX
MRKLVAAIATTAVLGGLAPIASQALTATSPARVADDLAATLASASSSTQLMVFVHGTSTGAAVDAIRHAGLTQVGEFASVGVPVAVGTPAQVRAVTAESGVTYVEQDVALRLLDEGSAKATRLDEALADPLDGSGPMTGEGQTVAIVDGGVDGTHPMFADPATGESKVVRNYKIACLDHAPGLSFAGLIGADPFTCPAAATGNGADNEPFIVDMTSINDTDTETAGGHGTHVAGIAAGYPVVTSDGQHLVGAAPGAKVVALAMGLSLSIYGENAALDWVERHHADPCGDGSCPPITVINNSYGGGGDWDPESVTSQIQAKLIADGVTVVWANGNGDATGDGGDGSENLSGRDAANPTPGVIAVANYDDADTGTRDGTLDPSSSRGAKDDADTWPDVSAPGTNITSACRPYLSICEGALSPDPNYGTITGTSMAAPFVTGTVATLQQAAVAKTGAPLSPAAIENLLEDTAHKFTFGADYVDGADAANPDNSASFDKGHGLVDVEAALHAVMGTAAPPAPTSESACAPGAPLVSDPKDDATLFALADTGTNEPTLDVTSVTVHGEPADERMAVVIHVADLTDENPSGTSGISFEGTLSIGDDAYDLTAERAAAGTTFTFGGEDVTGAFDAAADTVTVLVPRAVIGDRYGLVTVKSLAAGFSRRSYDPTPLGPVADDFAGAGATTVDVGGAPEPPDAVVTATAPYDWDGEATTAVSESDVGGVAVQGSAQDVKHVQVVVGPDGKVAFEVTCDSPSDDYDIQLTGPDGKAVGEGTDTGESANSGCAEKIVVTDAAPGVYTATVIAFTTVSGTYHAEVRTK